MFLGTNNIKIVLVTQSNVELIFSRSYGQKNYVETELKKCHKFSLLYQTTNMC